MKRKYALPNYPPPKTARTADSRDADPGIDGDIIWPRASHPRPAQQRDRPGALFSASAGNGRRGFREEHDLQTAQGVTSPRNLGYLESARSGIATLQDNSGKERSDKKGDKVAGKRSQKALHGLETPPTLAKTSDKASSRAYDEGPFGVLHPDECDGLSASARAEARLRLWRENLFAGGNGLHSRQTSARDVITGHSKLGANSRIVTQDVPDCAKKMDDIDRKRGLVGTTPTPKVGVTTAPLFAARVNKEETLQDSDDAEGGHAGSIDVAQFAKEVSRPVAHSAARKHLHLGDGTQGGLDQVTRAQNVVTNLVQSDVKTQAFANHGYVNFGNQSLAASGDDQVHVRPSQYTAGMASADEVLRPKDTTVKGASGSPDRQDAIACEDTVVGYSGKDDRKGGSTATDTIIIPPLPEPTQDKKLDVNIARNIIGDDNLGVVTLGNDGTSTAAARAAACLYLHGQAQKISECKESSKSTKTQNRTVHVRNSDIGANDANSGHDIREGRNEDDEYLTRIVYPNPSTAVKRSHDAYGVENDKGEGSDQRYPRGKADTMTGQKFDNGSELKAIGSVQEFAAGLKIGYNSAGEWQYHSGDVIRREPGFLSGSGLRPAEDQNQTFEIRSVNPNNANAIQSDAKCDTVELSYQICQASSKEDMVTPKKKSEQTDEVANSDSESDSSEDDKITPATPPDKEVAARQQKKEHADRAIPKPPYSPRTLDSLTYYPARSSDDESRGVDKKDVEESDRSHDRAKSPDDTVKEDRRRESGASVQDMRKSKRSFHVARTKRKTVVSGMARRDSAIEVQPSGRVEEEAPDVAQLKEELLSIGSSESGSPSAGQGKPAADRGNDPEDRAPQSQKAYEINPNPNQNGDLDEGIRMLENPSDLDDLEKRIHRQELSETYHGKPGIAHTQGQIPEPSGIAQRVGEKSPPLVHPTLQVPGLDEMVALFPFDDEEEDPARVDEN